MTLIKNFAQARVLFFIPVALVAAGFIAGPVGAMGPESAAVADQAAQWSVQVLSDRTVVDFQDPGPGRTTRSALVALPPTASSFTLEVLAGSAGRVSAPDGIQIMRGTPVVRVLASETAPGVLSVAVHHDGLWSAGNPKQGHRLNSPTMHAVLSVPAVAGEKDLVMSRSGSYVIIHAPAFTNTIAPLVEWKTRKGFPVVTVSTAVTGPTAAAIQEYLQDAYDTWDNPPEYVLLVGDVDEIPTYSFYGNPSDLPYVLLDGDDWLPDAMIGRLPVENQTEAETFINKIADYERHPYLDDGDEWFTRSIMVGGVEGSTTPPHTVRFCGEQLEKIGFAPATSYLHPPLPSNMFIASMFNPTMDTGASIVAYRGWAYGTAGWSDPRYTVDDMGGMANGGKLPVVMSFVCLNGDYTASSPCFGEAFVRLGQPDEYRGAIAFIGNGEHWSHTRYNDGMAISFFERIIDEDITDLGSLMVAGKMRFMDFFPHEMDAETYGEESVEFYFHIYNLMGDPELNFWKSTPVALTADHAATVAPGANSLAMTVTEQDGGQPVASATVAATAGGVLLGSVVTDESGQALLTFPSQANGSSVEVTVSGPGLIPYEGIVTSVAAGASIGLDSVTFDDGSTDGEGNADRAVNPGETLAVVPALINSGSAVSGAFTVTISDVTGPASVLAGSLDFASLAVGESATAGSLDLAVSPAARNGEIITGTIDAVRAGDQHDVSIFQLVVSAPDLSPVSLGPVGSGSVLPGQTFELALALEGQGAVGTSGGSVNLALIDGSGATLLSSSADFGPCAVGETVVTGEGLTLQIDDDTPAGTNLSFTVNIATAEGYSQQTTSALVVGPVDVTSVCGPDPYGYYAYDSADLDYPANRPVYQWQEISPNLGGPGTELSFPVDNEIVNVQVDLPFTFTYYGQDYTRIRVSDNGWIAFDLAGDYNFYNWAIPSEHGNNALIAPYWDNLVPMGDGGANGLAPDGIFYYHDAAAGTFTVEWSRLHHYKPQILGLQTFQVVLLDPAIHTTTSGDGPILFYYRDVVNNDYLRNYASVGIEDADGRRGLQLSFASFNQPGMAALQPGLAVLITTEPPVRVPFALERFTARENGGALRLDWTPSDNRPVLGWHVDRVDHQGITRLTENPLPGSVRTFTTSGGAGQSDQVTLRLTALHPYGATSQPGEVTLDKTANVSLALHRASPNPAPGSTSIAFALPEQGLARLRVYDAAGRLVRTLLDGPVSAGEGLQVWDGRDDRGAAAAGGIYFFRLDTRGKTLTRKVILVR